MNRPGPSSQPLRGIPGNVFQNQPSSGSRNTLGSGRLQNSKLVGNTNSGWGFMGGAPSFSQARGSSFASTIGGSQSHAPLDPSEFPSLSGAPQSQQSSSQSQATWGGQAPRAIQQPPVGRAQAAIGQSFQSSQGTKNESHGENKPAFPSLSTGGMDDYRFGDQGSGIQLSRSSDRQGGDDFPALGGLGGADVGSLRRADTGQNSRFNGLGSASTPGGLPGMGRNRILGQTDPHQDGMGPAERIMSPGGIGSGAPSSTRSPLNQNQDAMHRGPMPTRTQHGTEQTGQRYAQYQQVDNGTHNNSEVQSAEQPMSDVDKWGLEGLMSRLGGESIDQTQLGLGMDLTMLGLDLNRPEHEYLYQDWGGPFADSAIRPMIPKFNLPPAYTVTNVPPLATKMSSFADETLFTIFYSCPRDVAQDMAAQELYSRDWRWHKRLQQWLCKAKEFGEPSVLPSAKEERGHYYFFDVNNWRKERKEFILNYDHLHHMQTSQHIGAM